jgi:flagellar biosynthetic protein FliR
VEYFGVLEQIVRSLGFQVDVHQFIGMFGLGMMRLAIIFSLVPFLGGEAVPANVRTGLAVILTAISMPLLAVQPPVQLTFLLFVALMVKEALVGLSIGLLAQLVFFAVQMAGQLVDNQRGMNSAVLFSLAMRTRVSLVGKLKYQAAIVLFLTFDAHHRFIEVVVTSFSQIPTTTFPRFESGTLPIMEQLIRMGADMFVIAFQLAAPIILVLFLVDAVLGILARVAPQVNIFYEGMPVKSLVGLAMVFLVIGYLLGQLEGYFADMLIRVGELTSLLV